MQAKDIKNGVLSAIEGGSAEATFRIESDVFRPLLNEAKTVRRMRLARRVRDWHKTYRATLFPSSDDKPPYSFLFRSQLFSPKLHAVSEVASEGVRSAGLEVGSTILSSFTSDRLGFNYMDGQKDNPAEITPHVDKNASVIISLVLQKLPNTTNVGFNTNIFLGPSVCRELNLLGNSHHGVISHYQRISATIADFIPLDQQ